MNIVRRLSTWFGPIACLLGSLGLISFGPAFIAVVAGVAMPAASPPVPRPEVLEALRWAALSAMLFVVGWMHAHVSALKISHASYDSGKCRTLHLGAGALFLAAAIPLVWGVAEVRAGFRVLALSSSAPTIESVYEIIRAGHTQLLVGLACLLGSSILLLIAHCMSADRSPLPAAARVTAITTILALGFGFLGGFLLLLLIAIKNDGTAIEESVHQGAVKPAELAGRFFGILNKSWLLFGGLGALGMLHVISMIVRGVEPHDSHDNGEK